MQNKKLTQRRTYKLKNWAEYNKNLIQRGSINLWFTGDIKSVWYDLSKPLKPGRMQTYSNACIELCLVIKALYRLSFRQVQGFLKSFFILNKIKLEVPCYTQMSRRASRLQIPLKRLNQRGPIDIAIDSTGLKVYGEGEWKVRQHGTSKRRTWQKLHLAVDPLNHEIVASELTPCNWNDDMMMASLIDAIEQPVERVFADGAYDTSDCYRESRERGCKLVTPPQCNATVQSTYEKPWLDPRDEAIRTIGKYGKKIGEEEARSRWKHESDYHERSIAETAIYRFKRLLGNSLWSLREKAQKVEMRIKVNILNKFTELGMPDSIPELV